MIELLDAPSVRLEKAEWTLVLFVGSPWDDDYSFRDLLACIVAVMGAMKPAELSLPPEEPGEDFVTGSLRWGSLVYGIYFERSLGYLQFENAVESSILELLGVLRPSFVWPAKST